VGRHATDTKIDLNTPDGRAEFMRRFEQMKKDHPLDPSRPFDPTEYGAVDATDRNIGLGIIVGSN
jgi:hypothetical protein